MASFQPPPGYGFHPTDEELVDHYLRLKMRGDFDEEVGIIVEVKVCDYEPWELPGRSTSNPNDRECYFFCPRDYKYANSQRANRTTEAGYWKVTGKDRTVKKKSTGAHIATKKTLVYYKGRPNGVKTNWIMHEYNPTFNFNNQRDFLLCKLKKDPDDMSTEFKEGESSSNVEASSDFENFTNNTLEEDSFQIQAQLDSFRGYDDRAYNLNSALQSTYWNGNMY